MATLKGLTIEIAGDTTQLTKALAGVNSDTKALQTELREVEKLLKVDPTDMELLAQKQAILTEAIEKTNDKLSTLQTAAEQAKEQLDLGEISEAQYRNLQREITATEQELARLESQAEQTGQRIEDAAQDGEDALQNMGDAAENASSKLDLSTESALKLEAAADAVLGVAVGVGEKLLDMAISAGQTADELNTLSVQTGLSTDTLQKMQYASDLVDVSVDDLTTALKKVTTNIVDTADAGDDADTVLAQLGVSVEDVNGELRTSEDVFYDALQALSEVENQTERDALSMELFGKSGTDLNTIIEDGGEALKAYGEEAEAMGIIMDESALESAQKLNDSIDTLKATAEGAIATAGAELADNLIPIVEEITPLIQDILLFIAEHIETIALITAAIVALAAAIKLTFIIDSLVTMMTKYDVITKLTTASQAALNAVMNANPIAFVVIGVAALVAALIVLWNTNEDFRNAVIEIWDAISSYISGVVESIMSYIDGVVSAVQNAIEWFQKLAFWNNSSSTDTSSSAGFDSDSGSSASTASVASMSAYAMAATPTVATVSADGSDLSDSIVNGVGQELTLSNSNSASSPTTLNIYLGEEKLASKILNLVNTATTVAGASTQEVVYV